MLVFSTTAARYTHRSPLRNDHHGIFTPLSSSAVDTYARTLAKFVNFALNAASQAAEACYIVPLTDGQRAACKRFEESVTLRLQMEAEKCDAPQGQLDPQTVAEPGADEEDLPMDASVDTLLAPFHELLLSFVAATPSSPTTSPFWSPVIVFLVFASVTSDNDFVKANEISRLNAQVIYIIRAAVFKEILNRMKVDSLAFYV